MGWCNDFSKERFFGNKIIWSFVEIRWYRFEIFNLGPPLESQWIPHPWLWSWHLGIFQWNVWQSWRSWSNTHWPDLMTKSVEMIFTCKQHIEFTFLYYASIGNLVYNYDIPHFYMYVGKVDNICIYTFIHDLVLSHE